MSTTEEPARSSYELLSTPTQKITDEQVEAIVADLRKKRQLFLAGVQDKPVKTAAAKKPPSDAAAKKAATEAMAAAMNLDFDL